MALYEHRYAACNAQCASERGCSVDTPERIAIQTFGVAYARSPKIQALALSRSCNKHVNSPWLESGLQAECTDVCVLATVLGAVDRGYRTIVVSDALCSSSDETHDALMTLYARRYGQQIETVTTEHVMAAWGGPR